jgi:hypothetical protein
VHKCFVGECTDAKRRRLGAIGKGHPLGGVDGVKAVPRPASLAGAALPTDRAPVRDYKITRRHGGHILADAFDCASGLMAQHEGNSSFTSALGVCQIGVVPAHSTTNTAPPATTTTKPCAR